MDERRVVTEIAGYERHYPEFLREMRADVEELLATGAMHRARELSAATGQHLNHTRFPMYFTGDLDAEFILVQLNPAHAEDRSDRRAHPFEYASFAEYFDGHRRFGALHYGPEAPPGHYRGFDRKQIRFARPFGVIDFVEETDDTAVLLNLERVVDNKLQMELVPYGSPRFETSRFPARLVQPHFDRVLRVACARPRRYVLFCGSAFEPLVRSWIVKRHRFRLTRKDGTLEKAESQFAMLQIPFDGGHVAAGLCRTWARQGIPMASYAREVVARYEA